MLGLQVDEAMLREAFTRLFHALPAFVERYPDVVDPVKSIFFPPKGEGMFAFVEFMDDVLTTTAIAMNGFEYLVCKKVQSIHLVVVFKRSFKFVWPTAISCSERDCSKLSTCVSCR